MAPRGPASRAERRWRIGWLLLLAAGPPFSQAPRVQAGVADHLEILSTAHAVSGSEEEALQYIGGQLGPNVTVDNTGTLTAVYGSGTPYTLLVAGVDEPGYVVSGLNDEGYLRLDRLADPAPHYQFDNFFLGQPVSIRTAKGSRVNGNIAAPAVHLRDRGFSSYRQSNPDGLFVDVGARSPAEVAEAGVRLLDTVAIEKRFIRLGRTKVSAPWISSRAGAAVLLELARLLEAAPPRGTVTLAFAARQYRHQEGLRRVLRRVSTERVILLQPASEEQFQISAARGASNHLADELLARAQADGVSAQRGAAVSLETGPFGPADLFTSGDRAAVMSFGAAHAGTPAEVLDLEMLEQTGRLLAGFLEVEWKNVPVSPAASSTPAVSSTTIATEKWSLAPLIEQLAEVYGVSRSEAPVRNLIQAALPAWAAKRSFVDERGNLIVNLGRKGDPKALFVAHLDEIGFEVERIERTGKAATKPSGGLLEELFTSRPVVVLGTKGPLDAVMTNSGEIDVGAESREEAEAAGVAGGVTVATPKNYRRLFGSRISARSLDDRVGCAVLLAALQERGGAAERLLDRGEPVWIMFSVEEELGMLGSTSTAQRIRPQRVYAVDSFVTSDSPLEDRRRAHAPLGAGFVLRAIDDSGATPRRWVEYVAALARTHQIPVQYGVTAGGNDGSRFVEFGAVNIPLSWPLRYAHTAAEVADMKDIEALRKIVTVLVEQELAAKIPGAVE